MYHLHNIIFLLLFFTLIGCDESKTKPSLITQSKEEETKRDTFVLENTSGKTFALTLSNSKLLFHKRSEGIVLINLFATWCNPCDSLAPYLSDLQNKYEKDIFIAGIPTHDFANKEGINHFIKKEDLGYFISYAKDNEDFVSFLIENLSKKNLNVDSNFSIPLSIMYVEGNYFTHYEGIVPIEMIEYDIQQAQKQFKK